MSSMSMPIGAMGVLDRTSREPLFPLILEGIGESNGEAEPAAYLGEGDDKTDGNDDDNDANDDNLSNFWTEAHVLSCLKRASFQSSVDRTYDDAMSTLLSDGNDGDFKRASHLSLVRSIIGRNCAFIVIDGTITNDDADDGTRYRNKICMREANNANPSSGLASGSEDQLETAARLSALYLMGPSIQHVSVSEKAATSTHAEKHQSSSSATGGWFQYPTSFAQKITKGVGYAIDKALNAYEGDEDYLDRAASGTEPDDAYSSVKKMLEKEVGSSTDISLYDNGSDDADVARRKGVATMTTVGEDEALVDADEIISIEVVASACRTILEFTKQQQRHQEGANGDMFFMRHHHGGVGGVMLHRNGWDACSFGAFCRQAGSHLSTAQHINIAENFAREKSSRLGKILCDISERGAHLLASTLCQSNHALLEKDTITLFAEGVPSDYGVFQSDRALFQIHVTKLTIQQRMTRLAHGANVAKCNAVKAQRNGMTQLAMVHMRRRKASLEEAERCAAVLANLDASELRLERARDDAQVVQSYSLLRTALRDIRESKHDNDDDDENVEELMLDVREEMENVGEIGGEAIYPEVLIDEDELNEEFKLLEIECENEQSSDADNKDDARERQSNKLDVQPLAEQQNEDSDASKREPVAA